VDAVAVGLPLQRHRVGGGGERERDGSGHRGDVHPHLAAGVELLVDEVVRLLEGGVVVVHVRDGDAYRLRPQQVPEVRLQLL